MADFDDDAPPPLSSLPEQVDALRLRGQSGESTSGRLVNLQPDESLRVANVVIQDAQGSTRKAPAAAAAPAFKKGFFDAPVKRKPKPQHAAGGTQKPAPSAAEEIPMIRAKKGAGDGPSIPDFLRLEPDEEAKRYATMKSDLLQKLQPTPDMVTQIGKDPSLLAAFDDPEVMAAVNDIAANPGNMKKYQNKPKVVAFYAAMGKLMGEKLQKEQSAKKPTPS